MKYKYKYKCEMVSDPAVLFLFLLFSNAQMMMTRKLTVVTLDCEPDTSEAKYIFTFKKKTT